MEIMVWLTHRPVNLYCWTVWEAAWWRSWCNWPSHWPRWPEALHNASGFPSVLARAARSRSIAHYCPSSPIEPASLQDFPLFIYLTTINFFHVVPFPTGAQARGAAATQSPGCHKLSIPGVMCRLMMSSWGCRTCCLEQMMEIWLHYCPVQLHLLQGKEGPAQCLTLLAGLYSFTGQ